MKQFVLLILLFFYFLANVLALDGSDAILPAKDSVKFYDGQNFLIIGKFHNEKNYNRFPLKYKDKIRSEVWDLGQNSAGLSIRFCTNSTTIIAKWTVKNDIVLPHMASTGIKGVDLYANVNDTWQFIHVGRPSEKTSQNIMLEGGEPIYREYLLNLPLYDGVDTVSIGVDYNAEISSPKQQFLVNKKPVVYYGSSIAQGGASSRPGMAFTNILSRKLDRSFINMGFRGNGTFDLSVGEAMSEIDAALYVIDCNPNTAKDLIFESSVELVKLLKNNRPKVPVLLVENYFFDINYFIPGDRLNEIAKRKELMKAFNALKESGITNIYYQNGDGLIGFDHDGTVDGVHPNDLGMYRIAEYLLPQLKKILKKSEY